MPETPINIAGFDTTADVLTVTEIERIAAVGHWYSVRGGFGVVWVARRGDKVHVRWSCRNRFCLPDLAAILAPAMKTAVLLAVLWTAACGSSTAPTPLPPQPPPIVTPTAVTLTGRLTATNGGQALPGVQAALGATTVTTGGDGAFITVQPPIASARLSLTGPSILPRTLMIALTGSRDLPVDAIALNGPFDLGFYQAFARDRLESAALQPLRHWTTHPNLYLQTGADARTLDMVENVARASVTEWSNGRLGVATVERGEGSRVGQAGWLTILFSQEVGHCGVADVGLSGGSITFYPNTVNCGCGGYQVRPTAVRHEMGHAMGFFHTADTADIMFPIASQCDIPITPRERYHAAIAYNRPVGNLNPDDDPTSSVSLSPVRKR